MSDEPKRTREQIGRVVLTGIMAGPGGVARPGTVVRLPQSECDRLVKSHFARVYDQERDGKAQVGPVPPPAPERMEE